MKEKKRMKKAIIPILAGLLSFVPIAVSADGEITAEDFEKYSITEKYDTSRKFTITYPGQTNAEDVTTNWLINAPGGIYTGADAYEGNAAENIIAYSEQADGTLLCVPGGLNNGWHGAYNYPMNTMTGGGADSHLNQFNRRCAVVKNGANKALQLESATSQYVSTAAWYSYDEIVFSGPIVWQSDVLVENVAKNGTFAMSFTHGKYSVPEPFIYPSRTCGRRDITEIISFVPGGKIMIFGAEAGDWESGKYYTVKVSVDADAQPPKVTVNIKERESGTAVAEVQTTELGFDFSEKTGVDYYVNTQKADAYSTKVLIDNIDIRKLVFAGKITANSVAINGKGVCRIDFGDNIDVATLTDENVTVYKGDTKIEGTSVSRLNPTAARLALPELEPQTEYRVVIKGVANIAGIAADCTAYFRTKDLVTASNVKKTADGVSFTAANNSAHDIAVTAVVLKMSDGKILSGVYYKRLNISAGGKVNETVTGMADGENSETVLYIIDSMGGMKAEAPSSSAK